MRFSLKTFVPAALVVALLPVAAPAAGLDPAVPLLRALMDRPAALPLLRADFSHGPMLRPYGELTLRPVNQRILRVRMGCVITGTPVESPDDIRLTAQHTIAAGSVATWSIPGTSLGGTVTLPAMVPGQSLFVPNVLPGGWPAGNGCTAHVN